MNTVQVLLSTFNGERFLAELLDSVFSQDGVAVELLVRDDGSSDGTLAVLEKYAARHPITVVRGENIGVVASFFWLLQHASQSAGYVGLADQDDAWLPDKLQRAVELLAPFGTHQPAMYCSAVNVVDDELRPVSAARGVSHAPSFANALLENIAVGCTIVLNPAALKAVATELPGSALMHDWWIYQVVAGVGTVVYDRDAHILYRQHSGNTVGARSGWSKVVASVRRMRARRFRLRRLSQVAELHRIHAETWDAGKRALAERWLSTPASWRARMRFALTPDIGVQSWPRSIAFRFLLILNRL